MKSPIKIDRTITPENCEKKGFLWNGDRMYDPEAGEDGNSEFVDLTNNGGLLGESASDTAGPLWYGAYRPKERA